ncbi:hypothetical protein AOLI_G00060220 [Acnodon oligacanthus]
MVCHGAASDALLLPLPAISPPSRPAADREGRAKRAAKAGKAARSALQLHRESPFHRLSFRSSMKQRGLSFLSSPGFVEQPPSSADADHTACRSLMRPREIR